MALKKVFKDFKRLYTFAKVAEKSARHIQSDDLTFIDQASMVVQDGEVLWCGHTRELPKEYRKLKTIDMSGKTAFPAFVECHTHTIFAGHRAKEFELLQQGATYQMIAEGGGGIINTVNSVRKEKLSQLVLSAQNRIDRFLTQGVTTVEVKSGYGLNFESEVKILKASKLLKGARIVSTYLGPHAKPQEYKTAREYLDVILNDLTKVRKLTHRADIFIEKGYFELPWSEEYLKRAKELGFDLVVHGEQLHHTGATEVALKYEAKSVDHLVYASQDDIQKLSKSNSTAVLLPTSDFYLKIPYPKARMMIDKGVRVALATDFNPGSSPTQDLAFVGLLARTELKMTLAEVFAAYTVGAAYALGLESEVGSLSPGKRADFFFSESELEDYFYSVGHTPIQGVYRDGIQVV